MAVQFALGMVAIISLHIGPCSGFLLPSFLEFGDCGTPAPHADFDPLKFIGTWYTVLWVPNEYIPLASCINSNYTMHGDYMNILEKGLDEDGEKVSRQTILDFEDDPAMTFTARGVGLRPTAPFTVIATDYTNYACMYSCLKTFSMKAEFAWIVSRHPRLDKKSVDICKKALTQNSDFDLTKLEFLRQGESCPYWARLPENWKRGDYTITVNDISQLSAEIEDERKDSAVHKAEEHKVTAANDAEEGKDSAVRDTDKSKDSVVPDAEERKLVEDLFYFEPIDSGAATPVTVCTLLPASFSIALLTLVLSRIP